MMLTVVVACVAAAAAAELHANPPLTAATPNRTRVHADAALLLAGLDWAGEAPDNATVAPIIRRHPLVVAFRRTKQLVGRVPKLYRWLTRLVNPRPVEPPPPPEPVAAPATAPPVYDAGAALDRVAAVRLSTNTDAEPSAILANPRAARAAAARLGELARRPERLMGCLLRLVLAPTPRLERLERALPHVAPLSAYGLRRAVVAHVRLGDSSFFAKNASAAQRKRWRWVDDTQGLAYRRDPLRARPRRRHAARRGSRRGTSRSPGCCGAWAGSRRAIDELS